MTSRPLTTCFVLCAVALGCGGGSNATPTADAATSDAHDATLDTSPTDAPPADTSPTDASPADTSPADAAPTCTAANDTCPEAQHCGPDNTCVVGCRADDGCAAPNRRCDVAAHTCVECTTNAHCAAGTVCAAGRCVMGCTDTQPCPTGSTCCAGACVDAQTSTANCGACGRACTATNGVAACRAGVCAVASCTAPYGDCDRDASNGCETDTQTSASHCGGCGMACATRANATASCASGACAWACNDGFGDCDGDPANGCETDLRASSSHCGACGRACTATNAAGVCTAGVCGLGACSAGYGNCDGDASNGCETNTLTSGSHCGACGASCSPANATGVCAAGACAVSTCATGFGDCDGRAATGCETNTQTSAMHCGACGRACNPANGAGACVAGACTLASCSDGYASCDGDASNGCETTVAAATVAPAGPVNRFALAGSGADQTPSEAISVDVGPEGNVYVLSYADKIIVFDRDGRYIRSFARSVWNTAYDLAVDPATGQMWVVDPNNSQVVHLTASGVVSDAWTSGSGARGIAFRGGEVFVSDQGGNRVNVYTPGGAFLRTVLPSPAFSSPRGLAVGPSGNLYVSNFGDNTLRIVSATGDSIRTVGVIANPSDVAVDECRGIVYVLGETSDTWAAYRIADGTRLFTQSMAGATSHAGLALSPDGSRLYVGFSHTGSRAVALYYR